MRLTKVGDWIKYVTESGKTFFYNVVTNDFQWDEPSGTGHTITATAINKKNASPTSGKIGILCRVWLRHLTVYCDYILFMVYTLTTVIMILTF